MELSFGGLDVFATASSATAGLICLPLGASLLSSRRHWGCISTLVVGCLSTLQVQVQMGSALHMSSGLVLVARLWKAFI
jgi:hypothetical protein